MKRKIIQIDEEKCNGCGLCAQACHEGAIGMADGKARLLRDDYCDGLGDCLPACPADAIRFVEREAAAYDAEAVRRHMAKGKAAHVEQSPCGCPGMQQKTIVRAAAEDADTPATEQPSALAQWPVQIKLAPTNAPYFDGADLLIAADCTAYAYGNFHRDFMRGKVTLIGCPKLDGVDYTEKLAEIIRRNDLKSVTVVRMEVPCCGGLVQAVRQALLTSGKMIPWRIVTVSTDGQILDA